MTSGGDSRLSSVWTGSTVIRGDAPFDVHRYLSTGTEGRTITTYHRNKTVFRQDDPSDAVYYMQSGKAKISVTSQHGKEAVVALVKQGDFFGESCLSGQKFRQATATTMTESRIMRIAKGEFVTVTQREPAFADTFISFLLARNSQTEADLVDQLFNCSEKRLARVLLVLANFVEDGESDAVLPKISQKTLAEMVGTTLPRINFFMNKFRRMGLIDYNGRITVHRSLLDLMLHENPAISMENAARLSKD